MQPSNGETYACISIRLIELIASQRSLLPSIPSSEKESDFSTLNWEHVEC